MYTTLNAIKTFLQDKFDSIENNECTVELGAIEKEGQIEKNLLITLVRIEEETSVKKQQAQLRKTDEGNTFYANPDMCLNLYILISSHASYNLALQQINNTVYFLNSIYRDDDSISEDIKKLSIELQSPTAEQWNSLWQTLGSKVVPAVLYKARMVSINSILSTREVHPVSEDGVLIDPKSPLRRKLEQGQPLIKDEPQELLSVLNEIRAEGLLYLSAIELRFLFGNGIQLDEDEARQLSKYLIELREQGETLSAKEENLTISYNNN